MKRIDFKAKDGKIIKLAVWDEVSSPTAAVQISHGMSEHIERYDDFAKFLNKNGYIVIGDDHRAHGLTDIKRLGHSEKGKNLFYDTVSDLGEITDYIKEKYNLPVYLFGHSYGSFLSQAYLLKYSDKLVGCVLCGSAFYGRLTAGFGRFVAGLACVSGRDKPGKFFANMTFGSYDKKIKNGENGWLSNNDESNEKFNNDKNCGFICSNGFYYYFFGGLKDIAKADLSVINKNLPIFIIYGDGDYVGGCGKLTEKLYKRYKKAGLIVEKKAYKNMRHEILNEKDNLLVYNDVLKFLIKTRNLK